jgi:iron complex outermembrane receptor protein
VRSVVENGEPQTVGFEGEPFRSRVERGALFVQDEWEFAPRWGAYLGVRAESIATASRSSTDALRSTSGVVTPLLHLAFRPGNGSRDVLRASLTRSFRAPELAALMARPVPNTTYPVDVSNVQSAPDRVGNPDLRPELATGIDVSYEKYLPGGGVMSIGVFHRRIRDLIRNELVFEDVPWATAPRWVLRPVNLEGARSTGVEFELKGQAAEWLPQALAAVAPAGLNVRASASAYRSAVDGIPGPDDRLDGQQPWALNLGFDQRVAGTPLAFGVQLALAPEYTVQQTPSEAVRQAASRRLDAYATWAFGRDAVLRLSVNNALAPDARTRTESTEDSGFVLVNDVRRSVRPAFGMSLTLKL